MRPAALAALLALAAGAGAGEGPSALLDGRVELAPVCGNVAVEARPCAPRPLSVPIRVLAAADRHLVLELRSDDQGRFHLSLPPGDYLLAVDFPGPFRHPPQAVHLLPGPNSFLPISLDSGLR